MYIMDGEKFLKAEVREPDAETFSEAIGFCVYSNSKLSVNSLRSIFELLWNERTLNEELKMADKMQQEFINIAAHELRTPAQSILGYTELAKRNPQYMEKYARSFLEVMYRNAFRIHKLTKDILDVTRIEGQTLNLDKIRFNLKDLIKSLVDDIQPKLVADSNNNKVKVVYESLEHREGEVENNIDTVFVLADRDRIAQVISNLLDNALKFTHQGLVSIAVSIKENKEAEGENQNEVVVSRIVAQELIQKYFQGYLQNFPANPLVALALGCIYLRAL